MYSKTIETLHNMCYNIYVKNLKVRCVKMLVCKCITLICADSEVLAKKIETFVNRNKSDNLKFLGYNIVSQKKGQDLIKFEVIVNYEQIN